ncbi:MAG: phosphatase PAP2 family protein [Clostridia bacterium]|nr:phosphatase PAP2 family protein [Clostridia bacterium]
MTAVNTFDHSILYWIQESLRSDAFSPIVKLITHLGDAGMFWIALTLLLLIFRKTRRIGVTCMISMIIGMVITNLVIKNWAARIRPYDFFNDLTVIIERQKDFSFPSGHTTNSFACAWVIFRMAKKRYGVPALVLAILIALSRLYVGVHYPTDVFAGVVIGILSAECARLIVRTLRRHVKWFRAFTRKKA